MHPTDRSRWRRRISRTSLAWVVGMRWRWGRSPGLDKGRLVFGNATHMCRGARSHSRSCRTWMEGTGCRSVQNVIVLIERSFCTTRCPPCVMCSAADIPATRLGYRCPGISYGDTGGDHIVAAIHRWQFPSGYLDETPLGRLSSCIGR